MRKSSLSLILLSLMICGGCSTPKTPNVVVQEKQVTAKPPASMLEDPEPPVLVEVTETRHILDNSDAFELWGEQAVLKLRKLREWYSKVPEGMKEQ